MSTIQIQTSEGLTFRPEFKDLTGAVFVSKRPKSPGDLRPFIIHIIEDNYITLRSNILEDGSLVHSKRRIRDTSLSDSYVFVADKFMSEKYIDYCRLALEGKYIPPEPSKVPMVQQKIEFQPPVDVAKLEFIGYYKYIFPSLSQEAIEGMWQDYLKKALEDLKTKEAEIKKEPDTKKEPVVIEDDPLLNLEF